MNIRVWGTSLLMFLSTVTAVGQTANRYLKAPLPQDWEESGEVFQQILPVDDHWWKSFQDTKLDSLIALAVDRNYSVAMAINRIAAARANLWIERSNFFPSIGLNAGWTRQETSGNTSSLPQTTDQYYDASLSMSWELDIIGSIRKRVKAQKENFAASKEEYTGVMVSLAAEVASAYINLRELQQELEVAKKNSASQEEVLKITEVRYNTGLVAKLDVAQAKSVLYSTKASIPQLEAGINQYITTLAVLLGMYPQDIRPVLESSGTLPDYMEPIGVGMPVDLLLRRPDVRSAELSVNAQAALLGASKADWLPKVFLKGSFGYAARDLKDLTKSKSMTYEIAPSLNWTIFNGGQLVNTTRQAKAHLDEPINQINLIHPKQNKTYSELTPLLDKIEKQNMDIERQIKEIKEAENMRKEFSANVSHELKTPLTTISGYAELMKDGLVKPEDMPRFSATIYDEARRLISMIEGIIKLSRLDENRVELDWKDVDLYELAFSIKNDLKRRSEEESVTIHIRGIHTKIRGVTQILYEMFFNICENAIKYNHPGGEVVFTISKMGEYPTVIVEDTGIGIPKEDIDRIFERFYRVDKSHSNKKEGSGLGLSIVKHGAKFHHAEMEVESEVGKGTKITIVFPRQNSDL